MNSKKRFSINLDFAVGIVTGVILLAIALTFWLRGQIGIRVTIELPADNVIGPFETLTLNFSEPVDSFSTLEKFSLQPAVDGSFKFLDPTTLQFLPKEPFQPEIEYTLTIGAGALTRDDRQLQESRSWDFRVRAPLVVYLLAEENKSQLWGLEPTTGKSRALTDDSFRIFDFDTAHNGEFVVFSAFNEQGGIDLWRVEREGGETTHLLPCGPDRCTAPTISFSDRRLAYVHETANASPGLDFGSPRIWLLFLENDRFAQRAWLLNSEVEWNAPLSKNQQVIGSAPAWSPNDQRFSFFDRLAEEIHLSDFITGDRLTIPSQTGVQMSWSMKGDFLVFTDIEPTDSGSRTRVRKVNMPSGEITTLFGESDEWDHRYNSLAWSPAEDMLVVGFQSDESDPATTLWLVDPVTLNGQVIANQLGYVYSDPQWDLWGSELLFQQFQLKGEYKPEVGLWKPGMEEPQILVEGILPHWLP